MSKYRYVMHTANWTSCPDCKQHAHLLSHRARSKPSFWICWSCRRVWQVGVGECPDLDKTKPQYQRMPDESEPTPQAVPNLPVPP